MRERSVPLARRLLALAALALAACPSPGNGSGGDDHGKTPATPPKPTRHFPAVARPLSSSDDPYAVAGTLTLPPAAPLTVKHLPQIFKLSDNVYSGGEPDGPEGLNELAGLGIKSVISVDGRAPAAELAARYGLRYVHIPIAYRGISDVELTQLVKTFRELDPPFYVHGYHGNERGPAAAAIGRLTLDGASREQVLAEMRGRGGTPADYAGLYRDVAIKPLPTEKQTDTYSFSFPPQRQMIGLRVKMIDLPRRHDALSILVQHDWKTPDDHPRLDALKEATALADDLSSSTQLAEVQQRPQKFRDLLGAAIERANGLKDAIQKASGGDAAALESSRKLFADLTQSCADCHTLYRNQ